MEKNFEIDILEVELVLGSTALCRGLIFLSSGSKHCTSLFDLSFTLSFSWRTQQRVFLLQFINDSIQLMDRNSEFPFQSDFEIPFDLFVRKKSEGLGTRGSLRFTDSNGHLVYRVQHPIDNSTNCNSTHCTKLLQDASGDTLFSVNRVKKGSWKGFRGNISSGDTGFILEVNRTLDEFSRTEFDIILVGDHSGGSKTEMKMKGCPFKRSCTIYRGDSIVAETSLMYKLGIGKVFVPRNRFRVTIFPGFADHDLIVSLVAIFFDGRKIWI